MAPTFETTLGLTMTGRHLPPMTERAQREITFAEVQRLRLEPGETLVLRVSQPISPEDAEYLRGKLKRAFPENEVLIVQDGFALEVQ